MKPKRSLAEEYPELSKEWHVIRNAPLTPLDVTFESSKKVWWKCSKGHEWETVVCGRSMRGCPYCGNKKVCDDNCLTTVNPRLAREWHPIKNSLTPYDVTFGSGAKIWWQCESGHEWRTSVASRSNGTNCPYCSGRKASKENCLATVNPKLAKEWHPTQNGILTPSDIASKSNKKAWWICSKGHEWRAVVNNRAYGKGCPYCSGHKVSKDNCLAALNPKLAKEWHSTKNGDLTPSDVTVSSAIRIWWKCSEGHEWEAIIATRSNGCGCPYCVGKKVCEDNCLATLNPDLAHEWHPARNGDLTPLDVTVSSDKNIWWECLKGHEWQAGVASRSTGNGCPGCSGRTAYQDNCLATLNPGLAQEWHSIKNHELTPFDVTVSSGKRIWWECSKGHEWEASVADRSKNRGCPYCREFYNEKKCRSIFENIFDKKFLKNRKVLNCRLELDGYCDELKLAFEYNGEQHYKRHPYWHKKSGVFEKQQQNDRLKARLCEEKGINLIVIPYTENHRLEEFIRESCFVGV